MLITEILNDFQKREIALLLNKDGSGYQFINLDKGHICPGGEKISSFCGEFESLQQA